MVPAATGRFAAPHATVFAAVERIRERPWWQAWLKPFYVFHAPLDRLLWIDADCTVHGDLGSVLDSIQEQPFLVSDDTIAVTENDPKLYQYMTLPPACGRLASG